MTKTAILNAFENADTWSEAIENAQKYTDIFKEKPIDPVNSELN